MKGTTLILLCAVALATGAGIRQETGCTQGASIQSLVAHENCNQYYQCVFGEYTTLTCPNNLMYNPQFQVCDWPQNVDCGERVIPESIGDENEGSDTEEISHVNPHPLCAELDLSNNIMEHDTCNKFYMCSDGLPIVITCPGNLMYNADLKICDWPQNVVCKNNHIPHVDDLTANLDSVKIVQSSGVVATEDNVDEQVDDEEDEPNEATIAICAADDSEGVFVEHERCDKFYICTGGVPVSQPCPDGLLFNEELHVCDWKLNVQCGERVL